MTFAAKVIRFNKQLHYTGAVLPEGVRIMNPFIESEQAMRIVTEFCDKYLNDTKTSAPDFRH